MSYSLSAGKIHSGLSFALLLFALGWALSPIPHPPSRLLPEGETMIHFLDVGQGDAILLLSHGHAMVVDAGRKGASVVSRLRPLLSGSSLDIVVATHADGDHIGGMVDLLGEHPSTTFIEPGRPHTTNAWLSLMGFLAEGDHNIATGLPTGRHRWVGAAQVTLIPSPRPSLGESLNENGIVLFIRVGRWSIVLPGDAGKDRERRLLDSGAVDAFLPEGRRATLLQLGHHGSRNSVGPRWLDRLDPVAATCSAGRGNRYGHPHSETLERLEARGVRVDCTDAEGTLRYRLRENAIDLSTDNHLLWERIAGPR